MAPSVSLPACNLRTRAPAPADGPRFEAGGEASAPPRSGAGRRRLPTRPFPSACWLGCARRLPQR
eukprot:2632871-Alexandrium_andersonii.AAC.1